MVKGGKEKMWPWRQTNEQPKSENRATQLHTGRWVSQIPINQIRVEATKRDVSDSKQIFRHIFLETFANLVFSPSCTASEIIKHTMQSKVWPQQYLLVCFREGVKKRFSLGDLSQIWVGGGADSQTFGDIYQPLFFSTKVPKCGWVGQSKPKTKSKFWVKFIKCI